MKRVDHTSKPPVLLSGPAPKRFTVTRSGQRVLIGLTATETRELEQVALIRTTAVQHIASKRWFELYLKHERSWKKWLEQRQARKAR